MTQFAMNILYSYNELHESLYLEETLFVLHTDRSECVGTAGMCISGQLSCMIPETKHRLYANIQTVFLLCPCDGIRHTYLSQTQGFGSSNLPADIFSRIDGTEYMTASKAVF